MVFWGAPEGTAMDIEEGGVTLSIPGLSEDGIEESVFYNPRQERNRDVTVAALRAARDRFPEASSYLDAMAASGIRGLRAASEGWEVTCSDRNPDAVELCEQNFERNGFAGTVLRRDANVVLHEGRYDVVDLDPFGSPIPFADAAMQGTRALLCVTATDTAPLCGAHFRAGIRRYGAVPRTTEYHHEIGLRVLLSALVRTAARYDLAAIPLLSHVETHSIRTYLSLESGAQRADEQIDKLGTLWHCPECRYRESERGLFTERRDRCPACESGEVLTAGPLWLAQPHDPDFVRATAAAVDDDMGTARSSRRMLDRIAGELDRPTHYDQHVLCKRWDRSAGPIEPFLTALRDAGYEASRTHYGGTTFKTTAPVTTIKALTSDL